MSISVFKIFKVFGTVSRWADKALEDGKVTAQEAVDLGLELAKDLGLPTEFNLPTPFIQPEQKPDSPEESQEAEEQPPGSGQHVKPEE